MSRERLPREIRKCKRSDCFVVFEVIITSNRKYCSRKCSDLFTLLGSKPAWNKGLTKETDERVLKISNKTIENHKNGQKNWNEGLTRDTDIRLLNLGKKISKTKKKKVEEGHVQWSKGLTKETDNRIKSHTPWNKGKTKDTDSRIAEQGKKHSKIMKNKVKEGLKPWNKGKTKNTDIRVNKMGENYPKNRKSPVFTEESKRNKSNKLSGKNNCNYNPDMAAYQRYKINCQFHFNLGDFPEEFELKKVRKMFHPFKNKHGYTRDHMLSIFDGFNQNIDPKIISHPANCKLIKHSKNSSKNKKSSITLNVLQERIIDWDRKYA